MPWLGRLQQPTLVLAGDDDPIVPLVNGRILARRIPCARLHVVPGGGHLFLLERPAELTKSVSILYGLGGPATGRAVLAAHSGMAEAVAYFDEHLTPLAAGPRRRRTGAQAHRTVVTVL